jgi:hypothetical protein
MAKAEAEGGRAEDSSLPESSDDSAMAG